MKIVFATNNKNKVREIQEIIGDKHQVVTLNEIGIHEDIPEPYETLEENAMGKAKYVWERTNTPVFADDTGLEVDALDGAPGVYSARYAGEAKDANANIDKLLLDLNNKTNRKAQFRTVIAFLDKTHEHCVEGIVEGEITTERWGEKGFGYDPIFVPEDASVTFAQMDAQSKNSISHRGRAMQKFIAFLHQIES